jgi:hypothetical protein
MPASQYKAQNPPPGRRQATSVPSQARRSRRVPPDGQPTRQPLLLLPRARAPPETAPATARPRRWDPPPTTGDRRVRRPRRCGGLGLLRPGTPASTLIRALPQNHSVGLTCAAALALVRSCPIFVPRLRGSPHRPLHSYAELVSTRLLLRVTARCG